MSAYHCCVPKCTKDSLYDKSPSFHSTPTVTAHFRYTDINGVSMHRFGAEKTTCIRDFCNQGNNLKSQNVER